jgi:transposase, IS30 family
MKKDKKTSPNRGRSQLKLHHREQIEILCDIGYKQKDIAKVLEIAASTISKELKRNKIRDPISGKHIYKASKANQKARIKRKNAKYQGRKIETNTNLRNYIICGLINHQNPDEISGRMKLEKQPFYASKSLIYRWLYSRGQYYCRYLYSKKYKPKRRKIKTKRTIIPNRVNINQRFLGANNRTRYGHYEGDTIVSGRTGSKALSVIYERKTKYIQIEKINSLKPKENIQVIQKIFSQFNKTKSITFDNGIENRKHEELHKQTISTFFCDPYSPWQKGGVENANKMIRKFIPKGIDISKVHKKYIKQIVEILNNKPRKSLNYKTPKEIMLERDLLKNVKKEKKNTLIPVYFSNQYYLDNNLDNKSISANININNSNINNFINNLIFVPKIFRFHEIQSLQKKKRLKKHDEKIALEG